MQFLKEAPLYTAVWVGGWLVMQGCNNMPDMTEQCTLLTDCLVAEDSRWRKALMEAAMKEM